MATAASFPWSQHLQALQQRDSALAVLDGQPIFIGTEAALTTAGQALEQLLIAGQTLQRSDLDVGLVADELRRFQKYAAPGKPSLQIVQLRRQQSSVQQAQRVARLGFIANANFFVRALELPVPAKLGVVVVVERWLAAHLVQPSA
jgi:hypothetical protein